MRLRIRLKEAVIGLSIVIIFLGSRVLLFGQSLSLPEGSHAFMTALEPSDFAFNNPTSFECSDSPSLATAGDSQCPFKEILIGISRKPEIMTVNPSHDRLNDTLFPLDTGKKFNLFLKDTFEPGTFLLAGFNAGMARIENEDMKFGKGSLGYSKRYAAALTDELSSEFFGTFLFPSLFHEDPRYFRMAHGNFQKRLLHATSHVFFAQRDSGRTWLNLSAWMAAISSTALGNLYHPNNHRGFQPATTAVVISIGLDMGFDITREFWPEIARKLRIPPIAHKHLTAVHPFQH